VSLPVAVVGLVIGVIVWVLLVRKLMAKPWEAPAGSASPHDSPANDARDASTGDTLSLPPARVGLLILLAVITSLFGLFISAYYMRMGHEHGGDWHHIEVPRLLWMNTALLVLSSIGMQWG
jgi:cytochrome c oxidase subunit 3